MKGPREKGKKEEALTLWPVQPPCQQRSRVFFALELRKLANFGVGKSKTTEFNDPDHLPHPPSRETSPPRIFAALAKTSCGSPLSHICGVDYPSALLGSCHYRRPLRFVQTSLRCCPFYRPSVLSWSPVCLGYRRSFGGRMRFE